MTVGNPYNYPQQTKKRRVWPWIVLAAVLVLLALVCLGTTLTGGDNDKPVQTPTGSGGLGVKAAPPQKSMGPETIGEGTWLVGKDVKPGHYKTTGASDRAMPLCYWDIRSGSEDGEIKTQGVKNKVGAQGLVTLKKGEYFNTSGCADWTRTGS